MIKVKSLAVLERIVERTRLSGAWIQFNRNYRQFHAESGAILNWWASTGTVSFQGINPDEFESLFVENIADVMTEFETGHSVSH
jgi:hypothetical protein